MIQNKKVLFAVKRSKNIKIEIFLEMFSYNIEIIVLIYLLENCSRDV